MMCVFPKCTSETAKKYETFDRREPFSGKKDIMWLCQPHYNVLKTNFTHKNWCLQLYNPKRS